MNERVHSLRASWYRLKELEFVHRRRIRIVLFILLVAYLLVYQLFLKAPSDFPLNQMVHVTEGYSLEAVTASLEGSRVIRSPAFFKLFVYLLGTDRNVMAGDYLFTSPISSPRVAWRLLRGAFHLTPVAVTVPEGASRKEMAVLFERHLPVFLPEVFLQDTKDKEGYLFPDTYFFFPNAGTAEIIAEMERNFSAKLETLRDDIEKTGKSEYDIITMASILEHEARTSDDRKIIAGILWKRIELGMPLQVDAPFVYWIGKNTYELTTRDLETDSPYNTYTRRGLPLSPIGNPGLDSILAAVYPKESPYLYYLSDREGNVYYSATYDRHRKNKVLYIN